MTESELDLLLARKETIADGVVRLTFRHPEGQPLPTWTPGAHLDLLFDTDLVRQYSLCGDPADRSTLQVAVLREEAGRGGSQYVHDQLAEGSRVRVRGPRNHFQFEKAKRYLFIAGGIGITPLIPMIAEAATAGDEWRLVYGGRTRASMAFRDQLEAEHPDRVEIRPQDELGLLDLPALLAEPDEDGDTAIYCCGPEPLLAAVEEHCTRWPAGTLHVERFAPKPVEGVNESFEIELAQTGRILTVPADRSILEVIEDSGVAVLSSCQEGTCGTCETTVLSGTPDHRDSILTPEEQEAGDTMMICVSRSCSNRLVLDL
ncbi:PDR/VanB family oxidoreductase [Saccharopolyspora sp. K220]|uniref:PDR/VanB family oxidoreductase n=1 Tax=Saccharopolyspora soli TaxID=2926618 RepID=UPI001F5A1B58|nr:PDR/VanB family oxidoreductase [Saccharopolyspora soli]MCI2417964.1 PDR/VanB family oxidoreductase [Saccharopolyspora soli]